MNENDHDLIIEVRAELKGLRQDVKDIKENIKGQIDDHEARLRSIERWVWTAIGALAVIQFIIGYILIWKFGNTPL